MKAASLFGEAAFINIFSIFVEIFLKKENGDFALTKLPFFVGKMPQILIKN